MVLSPNQIGAMTSFQFKPPIQLKETPMSACKSKKCDTHISRKDSELKTKRSLLKIKNQLIQLLKGMRLTNLIDLRSIKLSENGDSPVIGKSYEIFVIPPGLKNKIILYSAYALVSSYTFSEGPYAEEVEIATATTEIDLVAKFVTALFFERLGGILESIAYEEERKEEQALEINSQLKELNDELRSL